VCALLIVPRGVLSGSDASSDKFHQTLAPIRVSTLATSGSRSPGVSPGNPKSATVKSRDSPKQELKNQPGDAGDTESSRGQAVFASARRDVDASKTFAQQRDLGIMKETKGDAGQSKRLPQQEEAAFASQFSAFSMQYEEAEESKLALSQQGRMYSQASDFVPSPGSIAC
jgi:hypothetical protein